VSAVDLPNAARQSAGSACPAVIMPAARVTPAEEACLSEPGRPGRLHELHQDAAGVHGVDPAASRAGARFVVGQAQALRPQTGRAAVRPVTRSTAQDVTALGWSRPACLAVYIRRSATCSSSPKVAPSAG
jgi:hypothetical protein